MRRIAVLLVFAAVGSAQVRLPAFARHTLPNGIQVILAPRKEIPMVTLRAVIRGGSEADPSDLAGLTAATFELLRRGTASRSADRFAEELDALGAEMSIAVDEQSAAVTIDFLTQDAPVALALFADALMRPAFDEKEVRKTLDERIDGARAVKDDPGALVGLYFRPLFYGANHPYGHSDFGDEISLKRIGRADVLRQFQRLVCGKNTILVAAGDFEAQKLLVQLRDSLGPLLAGSRYEWARAAGSAAAKAPALLLVDKSDATQTYFTIGQQGIHRTHSDRTVLWLVNTLFGGRFTSMLNDELRVNSGLTYGAASRVDLNRLPGAIMITSFTKTETTTQAIDLALEVVGRLRERGITAEQLASAKNYLKGTYPTEALETSEQVAGLLGDLELHGLGRGEVDDLFSRIDAVTLEQANAAARKYYQASNLRFCLVANAEKVRDAVKKYAPRGILEVKATAEGVRIPER